MKKEVYDAINQQINLELKSAYLYLNMHVAMVDKNLSGFGAWLKKQWHEEIEHAEKLIDYLQRRNQKPVLESFDLMAVGDEAPLAVAEAILEHEKLVSRSIDALRKLAIDSDDQATEVFLQWFVEEQVEEEENAQGLVDLFTFVGDDKAAKMMADGKLGGR